MGTQCTEDFVELRNYRERQKQMYRTVESYKGMGFNLTFYYVDNGKILPRHSDAEHEKKNVSLRFQQLR